MVVAVATILVVEVLVLVEAHTKGLSPDNPAGFRSGAGCNIEIAHYGQSSKSQTPAQCKSMTSRFIHLELSASGVCDAKSLKPLSTATAQRQFSFSILGVHKQSHRVLDIHVVKFGQ